MRLQHTPWAHGFTAFLCLLSCQESHRESPPTQTASAVSIPLATPGTELTVSQVGSGFKRPVDLLSLSSKPQRLFILEQEGKVWVLENGKKHAVPFLDLSKRVGSRRHAEQGLLGGAFHPNAHKNGRLFLHYSNLRGDTVLSEFKVRPDSLAGNSASSEKILFETKQPYGNHNGGQVAFGPDGKLYLGLGDGGAANDPHGNGQNLSTPLGKLLRFDVSTSGRIIIPDDNPFKNQSGTDPNIWAYGLRNPWRFSFDRGSGDLYIADVGQSRWEWIHLLPAGSRGQNFGWNRVEGFECLRGKPCDKKGLVPPVLAYSHKHGCSITGGYVYRGKKIPQLAGTYFYADYCAPWIRSFQLQKGAATLHRDWSKAFKKAKLGQVSSFGQDALGELYILDHQNGKVWKITANKHP